MKNKQIKNMCLAATFTAVVYVLTAYLQIPSSTGYVHIGDAFIMLSAAILPTPYAVFVGAAGATLADCLTGYAIFAPASLIIKGVTVLFFTNKKENIINLKNLLALIPSAVLCIGGYYLYEAFISGNFIAPLSGIIGSIMQVSLSSLLFIVLGLALDKLKIKKML